MINNKKKKKIHKSYTQVFNIQGTSLTKEKEL